jgi:hypothetical protein
LSVVEEGVREVIRGTEQLAWVVLLVVDWTQGKGSTVRLVAPRAPEVRRELAPTIAEHEILSAEEYLYYQGYIAPTEIALTWGTYTITPKGLDWLDAGFPLPEKPFSHMRRSVARRKERPHAGGPREEAAKEEPASNAQPRATTGGPQEGAERSWWRRVLRG